MRRVLARYWKRYGKVLLLILFVAVTGCAVTPPMTAGQDAAASWQAQRSGNGRTTTVGLPLSRAAKIGLWSGVAVLIAYLMADDDDEADDSAAVASP